jgi:hypothetical protein
MKKNLFLIGIVLVLAAVYVIYFTDWFRPKMIQLSHTVRPINAAGRFGPAVSRLTFGLDNDYELTEVKVVPFAEWQTNKDAQPLWHLVSDEGSDDINHFFYGENISGMDSAVEGAKPQPLQPGVKYLLLIAAGRAKGQHEFLIGNSSADISTNK